MLDSTERNYYADDDNKLNRFMRDVVAPKENTSGERHAFIQDLHDVMTDPAALVEFGKILEAQSDPETIVKEFLKVVFGPTDILVKDTMFTVEDCVSHRPNWGQTGVGHQWKPYISDNTQMWWHNLSFSMRLCLAYNAQKVYESSEAV